MDCSMGALYQHGISSSLRLAGGTGTSTVEPLNLPEKERLVDDARLMLPHVIEQIRAGNLRPHPSGIEHLKPFGAIAACVVSSRTGQPVVMREFFEEHN